MTDRGIFKIYNVGTGSGTTVKQLIATLEKVIGKKISYNVGPRRCGDVESVFADTSKIKNELNISCDTVLEKSLNDAWIWQQYLNKKAIKLANYIIVGRLCEHHPRFFETDSQYHAKMKKPPIRGETPEQISCHKKIFFF